MVNKSKRQKSRRIVEMPIGQSHLMVVLQRVGSISKTRAGSKRGFLINFFHVHKGRDDRVSNRKPKKGRGTSSPSKKPICGKCGKKYYGDCLIGTDNCYGCGKSFHKVEDFPNMKGQDNGIRQSSGSNVDPLKKNHFDALRPSGEQNSSSDVVTNMLQVFTIDLYDLLYLGTTLSFFNLSSS